MGGEDEAWRRAVGFAGICLVVVPPASLHRTGGLEDNAFHRIEWQRRCPHDRHMTGRISAYLRRLPIVVTAALLVSGPLHSAAKDKKVNLSREAKLYRVPTGDVFTARYHFNGKGKGQMQIDLSAPQVLSGQSVPVKNGDARWGQLFRAAGDPLKLNGLQRGVIS